ncbi:MAG TPA: histidinol-phosphatase [candidate division Zixibacteria bacterium]|nr:histidinol-phosphatase [candidate division Zixibacteria bacterium]
MSKLPELFEYVGAIHIHTKDSDGSKTHKEIIRIANRYHLDFLIFTDHMTMAHKDVEGWHDRLLCLVGYEIQDAKDENHYLAIDLDEVLPDGLSAPEYVRRVRDKGGIGIIAHPDEVRDIPEVKAYPWTAWHVDVFDGIEVWNHMSAWLEGLEKNTRLRSFLHPRSILGTPSPTTLARWDEAAEKRRVLGVGSLDAHAATYRFGPLRLTLFPYKVQLQSIRTHVLTEAPLPIDDFEGARKKFLKSFKYASVFISNYRWGNARGFRFWCESKRQMSVVGGSMSFHPSIVFKVEVPEEGTIRLVRSGEVVAEAEGKSAEFPVKGDGAYRVEVLKGEKGWIYSNHIKIFPSRRAKPDGGKQGRRSNEDKPSDKQGSSQRRRRPRRSQESHNPKPKT